MKHYWFKPKRYGYGMYPTTWQGWLATLAFIGAVLLITYVNNFFNNNISPQNVLYYLVELLLIILFFLYLTKDKVEGGIKWRWGRKKD